MPTTNQLFEYTVLVCYFLASTIHYRSFYVVAYKAHAYIRRYVYFMYGVLPICHWRRVRIGEHKYAYAVSYKPMKPVLLATA